MEARLDKVYTTLPAWALLQLSAKSWLDLSAQMTKQKSLSDHAMLRWHFVKKSDKGKQFRPIPLPVFKHKRFRVNLKKMEKAACLDSLGPAERLAKHKEIMLEAANFTKREMLLCESS
eukprot:7830702-Karenia_brevis.AAC.1